MTTEGIKAKKRARTFYHSVDKTHLQKLVESGWTDEQIADFFYIPRKTLDRWKTRHPDFKENMLDWKRTADAKVEKSLYKRACGYEVIEQTRELDKDDKMVVVKEVTKHVAASDVSMIFWLTNRQHGDWKRTREETGADPLSVKILQIIKNGNGKGGNGTRSKSSGTEEINNAITIERGGVKIV